MINSGKISIHRFIATTLFRVVKEWPHSSAKYSRTDRKILPLLIIIVTAPLRVERGPKFILFKFKKYNNGYIDWLLIPDVLEKTYANNPRLWISYVYQKDE